MAAPALAKKLWIDASKGAILPLATLALVALMVVPMPAFVLDVGFIGNIMISLAVLMVALNAAKPLDFSAFPTVLLFTTLLRLSLNVASTRVVLVNGHTGAGAAGHVIEAFGSFLIGGDYVVGLFVFAIIMIINLVVITKGAGRVSEVSARFTLDALPGKQMAIDADLNAGLLTPEDAKLRRQEGRHRGGLLRFDGWRLQVREGRCRRRRADPRCQRAGRACARRGRPQDGRSATRPGTTSSSRSATRSLRRCRRCCCRSRRRRSSRACPRRSTCRARSPASSAPPRRGRRWRRSSPSSGCCPACRMS